MFRLPVLIVAALFLLLVVSAQAQPPTENCTGADLDGGDMFPFMGSITPVTNDFAMTGSFCGGEEGTDAVVCFTPTTSCNVDITCTHSGSVNVFVGPCTSSPASCVDSNNGSGSVTISDLNLTAGQNVCVVCEGTDSMEVTEVTIAELSGPCGPLPVDLQSFEIE